MRAKRPFSSEPTGYGSSSKRVSNSRAPAAATTFLRDISEFLPVAFLLLFYATPVIYSIDQLPEYRWLINLNPMTHYVNLLRSATYELRMPGLTTTLFCMRSLTTTPCISIFEAMTTSPFPGGPS